MTYVIRMTSELGSLADGGIRGTGTFVSLFLAGTVRGPSGSAADRVIERRTHSSARYEELTAILSGRPRALSALYLFTHNGSCVPEACPVARRCVQSFWL